MKYLNWILIVGCLAACTFEPLTEVPSEIDNSYANTFSNLKDILRQDNGKFWNEPLYGPILLVDPSTRVFHGQPK